MTSAGTIQGQEEFKEIRYVHVYCIIMYFHPVHMYKRAKQLVLFVVNVNLSISIEGQIWRFMHQSG